ncbi:MAG TPA: glycosyltransferase family 4 protein [Actinomycetes bacterium]|nr:glycosyltransferase family 4 protein [Actinomycetes bacterium]
MTRLLVVTNDFPPRPGGIQTFVHELVRRLDPADVMVYTSKWKGWEEFDADQPFEVVREDTSVLLPTPGVRRRAVELLRSHGCNAVLFGAAAPLGLLGRSLRVAGASKIVALTHGHESGWAKLPAARQMLRRIGDSVDVVTYLGEYTRRRIGGALSPVAAERMVQLTPGVDTELFRPDADRAAVRQRLGLGERPVVVCVSRLMRRKGQDTLIEAFPALKQRMPDVALLLVGGGPYRGKLEQMALDSTWAQDIVFTGSVAWPDLPAHYAAGDVFAMPCRTRRRGLDVEGLGIVYLEASATGLPVIAGDSGGAPDAVIEGETGWIVRNGPAATAEVVERLSALLADGPTRAAVGERGRKWVQAEWSWEKQVDRLRRLIS